ncbi:MAG: hypothetical protein RLZ10_1994 [Bacteroidota bacterium]|jgi:hypothetical protein
MKYRLLFGFFILCSSLFAQVNFSLSNAVIIGQFDKPEDRFSIEINTTELLSSLGIKSMPSLNLLKTGADSRLIATDSIKAIIREKGFDTYLIVSVKGYDRRFKVSERQITLEEALGFGNLFNLYRDEISSITFEFSFFRNDKVVFRDMVKCENVSDRNSVIKKYRKKLSTRIQKKWRG